MEASPNISRQPKGHKMSHGLTSEDTMYSVRTPAWHGLGVTLDDYPADVEDALEKSGLGWEVKPGDVHVAIDPDLPLIPAEGYKANIRQDTGKVLGIVSNHYGIVQNREAFVWLEDLLGDELEWETAGSLGNGKRVWVLAKIPENTEVGGDETATYVFCANSHDGSMAVTAAATRTRIVCNNTLSWAIKRADAQRTYKFRHTGDLALKLDEARYVMQVVRNWDKAFAELGNDLAQTPLSLSAFDKQVITPLLGMDDPTLADRPIAKRNREDTREEIIERFRGTHPDGDTSGNSPGSKWCAANAIAEYADWGRRVTEKTDLMHRHYEDTGLKQRGLELVLSA